MRVSTSRKDRFSQTNTSISNLMQLKLMQSEHLTSNQLKRYPHSYNTLVSITNTPQTDNNRNFHSCRLEQRLKMIDGKQLTHLRMFGKERGCESVSKILTLQQIKMKEETAKMKATLNQSPSKKIFVSIAQHNSRSLDKNKTNIDKRPDPQINLVECNLLQERQHRPGIKINIYREIARRNGKQPQ